MSGSGKPFVAGKGTMIVLLLAAMPALLGTVAVDPALPPLATALSGFLIGAISDRYGRKRVLIVSLALFGLAGSSGFFFDSVTSIIFWRLWLGVGLAGLLPTVTTLLKEVTMKGRPVPGIWDICPPRWRSVVWCCRPAAEF